MEQEQHNIPQPEGLFAIINKLIVIIAVLLLSLLSIPFIVQYNSQPAKIKNDLEKLPSNVGSTIENKEKYWAAADFATITNPEQQQMVAYGKDLIAHTAKYLGPTGSVLKISNGMNCQNCHLQAGTAVFGNNYGSVASLYPRFRARSGTIENIYKRVNDCVERSLNGTALDTSGKEMLAIVAYINFIGSNVPKGDKAAGSGLKDLPYLDRAADPAKGKTVYTTLCQSCHQPNGEGLLSENKIEFTYPPLWGKQSFNVGAGLYRISNFAKYVKYNMPQGITHNNPQLSDEEAWDVAAFVLSMPHPHFNINKDWPDISKKPADHPFGPYADTFSAEQHKWGPFQPIIEKQTKK